MLSTRLAALGLELPAAQSPVATYVMARRSGDLLFVSGHVARDRDGGVVRGVVGADIAIAGAGFDPANPVTLNQTVVPSRFVTLSEIHIQIPQVAPGQYTVSINGVGNLPLTVVAGSLTVSPTPFAATIGQPSQLTVTLPVVAPPGNVTLNLAATPPALVRIPSLPPVAARNLSLSVGISGVAVGSGTLQVSGTGFTTSTLPFTSALAPARCRAQASAGGGIDLFNLVTGQPAGHIPSTSTPGRIVASPDGKRAVAQYNDGIAFIDLVNCPLTSLGSFATFTTPPADIVFSPDSQYVVVDWSNQVTGSYGVGGWALFDASSVLQDATLNLPAPAIGLNTANGTGDFAFASFFFAGTPPTLNMNIYHLMTPHASQCSLKAFPATPCASR